jgi:hypothetical protein
MSSVATSAKHLRRMLQKAEGETLECTIAREALASGRVHIDVAIRNIQRSVGGERASRVEI